MEAGCDVWLNNPIRPHEASGTSGMKAGMNGCLNVSIPDGWCPEGIKQGKSGWLFGKGNEDSMSADANELYELLEKEILPVFYDRDSSGIPVKWTAMMKSSIQDTTVMFGMERFITDYIQRMYLPSIRRSRMLTSDNYRIARELAKWKTRIREAWPTLSIKSWDTANATDRIIPGGTPFTVNSHIQTAGLFPEDFHVEIWYGKAGEQGWKSVRMDINGRNR